MSFFCDGKYADRKCLWACSAVGVVGYRRRMASLWGVDCPASLCGGDVMRRIRRNTSGLLRRRKGTARRKAPRSAGRRGVEKAGWGCRVAADAASAAPSPRSEAGSSAAGMGPAGGRGIRRGVVRGRVSFPAGETARCRALFPLRGGFGGRGGGAPVYFSVTSLQAQMTRPTMQRSQSPRKSRLSE